MTVYVDEHLNHGQSATWRYKGNSHMIGDTHDELDAMARSIGLRAEWIQQAGTPNEHYDLTASKRRLALQRGAVAITWHELGDRIMEKRRAAVAQGGGNP